VATPAAPAVLWSVCGVTRYCVLLVVIIINYYGWQPAVSNYGVIENIIEARINIVVVYCIDIGDSVGIIGDVQTSQWPWPDGIDGGDVVKYRCYDGNNGMAYWRRRLIGVKQWW